MDERTIRNHRISLLLSNRRDALSGIHAGRNPLFFVGHDGLSGYLNEPGDLVNLPIWPIMQNLPDIHGLADRLTLDVLSLKGCGPYLLGGYCFGGLIAYEVASRLVRSGHRVGFLGLVETSYPGDCYSRLLLPRRALLAVSRPSEIVRFLGRRSKRLLGRLGLYRGNDDEAMRARERFLEAYYGCTRRALRGYEPTPYGGDVTLFFGHRSVEQFFPQAGWKDLIGGFIRVQIVKGDHCDGLFDTADLAARLRGLINPIREVPSNRSND